MNILTKSLLAGIAVAAIVFIASSQNKKNNARPMYNCTYQLLTGHPGDSSFSFAGIKK